MSQICSVSVRAVEGALAVEEVGKDAQEATVLRRELYFVSCSVVRIEVAGTCEDAERWGKGVWRGPET